MPRIEDLAPAPPAPPAFTSPELDEAPPTEPVFSRKPPSLLERYLGHDIRPLLHDAELRPKHYSAEHHATLRKLRTGVPCREHEASALLLQYMRRTEAHIEERKIRRDMSQKSIAPATPPPAFEEQQDFSKAITLI